MKNYEYKFVKTKIKIGFDFDKKVSEMENEWNEWQCKELCVLGRNQLLFGKNQDMTILIEKEYFYASCKGTNSTNYYRKQH